MLCVRDQHTAYRDRHISVSETSCGTTDMKSSEWNVGEACCVYKDGCSYEQGRGLSQVNGHSLKDKKDKVISPALST